MGCDQWTLDDDMLLFVNDANALLDHWKDALWLSWAEPVALMPATQALVRQRQEEEAAVQRARKEAQRVMEVAQPEEERRAKETAALSKQSIKKPAPRKASKAIPIPKVAVMSNSNSDDTLGASQSKLQEYKDMWAAAKEGNIAAGYVAISPDDFESFRLY